MPTLPSGLSRAALLRQTPLALLLSAVGLLLGIPVGKLLHDQPWRGVVQNTPRSSPEKRKPPTPVSSEAGVPANASGLTPAETEAKRVADSLNSKFEKGMNGEWEPLRCPPLSLAKEVLELGTRGDVEMILRFLRSSDARDLLLCGWADIDPEAAWEFWVTGRGGRGPAVPGAFQFIRRMASRHWPLVRDCLTRPSDEFAFVAPEAWEQRIRDVAHDPVAVREMATRIPERKLRGIVIDRAMRILSPKQPEAAVSLSGSVSEGEREWFQGRLAGHLACSHPALALGILDGCPMETHYTWIGDDYSPAFLLMEMTVRRDPAGTLSALAKFSREGRTRGEVFITENIARQLPGHMEEWLPPVVERRESNS